MSIMNEVRLIGNLGQKPELHTSDKGVKVLKLSLATNETYTDKGGNKVTKTDWHNLVLFGRRAEVVQQYCVQGSKLAVVGKLSTRTYQDKNGGDRYITEVIVNDILFLDGKADK